MLTVHYPQTDSTQARAKRLATLNPRRWCRVTALSQTRGRGRHGRDWHSPAGGAWFSLVWPCKESSDAAEQALRALPVAVGLAVSEALTQWVDEERCGPLQLKWPNDVLLNGRKLAGVLCERWPASQDVGLAHAMKQAHAANPASVIIGIGINVNSPPPIASDEPLAATSLRHQADGGQYIDISQVIDAVTQRIVEAANDLRDEGLAPATRDRIEAQLAWRGETVCGRQGPREITGELRGIDAAGRLQLATAQGPHHLDAGEVQHCRRDAVEPAC